MIGDTERGNAIEVFISYSHKDKHLRGELENHLTRLKRTGVITIWHDRKIDAGQKWADQIDEHLNTAQVVLLLISSNFLASDYCYDVEASRAMERSRAGDAHVIAVILRPVDWEGTPFSELQCLPTNAKPVTSWSNRDKAFADVAMGIRKVVDKLLREKQEEVTQQLIQAGVNPQATAIFEQILADAQRQRTERWKILKDVQTKIFEIQQDVTVNQARTADEAFKKWSEYIKG